MGSGGGGGGVVEVGEWGDCWEERGVMGTGCLVFLSLAVAAGVAFKQKSIDSW